MVTFTEKLLQSASTKDVMLFHSSLETKMAALLVSLPALDLASTVQLEFISNFQAIQVGVRNQFGYIKSGSSENTTMLVKQPPIARPVASTPMAMSSVFSQLTNSVMSGLTAASPTAPIPIKDLSCSLASSLDFQNNCMNIPSYSPQQLEAAGSGLSSSPLEFP